MKLHKVTKLIILAACATSALCAMDNNRRQNWIERYLDKRLSKEIIKFICKGGNLDAQNPDETGTYRERWFKDAVQLRRFNALKLLIKKITKEDLNKLLESSFFGLPYNTNTIQKFLKIMGSVHEFSDKALTSIFHSLIRTDNIEGLSLLVKEIDLSAKFLLILEDQLTLFEHAVYYNSPKSACWLLQYNQIPYQKMSDDVKKRLSTMNITPLHIAAGLGDMSNIVDLVKKGADVNVRTTELNITPLVLAAQNGHLEVVKFLLKVGAQDKKAALKIATNPAIKILLKKSSKEKLSNKPQEG